MVRYKLIRVFIGLILWIFVLSACYFVERVGELEVNSGPHSFVLRGETVHSYHVRVKGGKKYRIDIEVKDIKGHVTDADIQVCSGNNTDGCSSTAIAYVHNGTTLTFVGPASEEVSILISNMVLGEGGAAAGTCSIQLLTIDS